MVCETYDNGDDFEKTEPVLELAVCSDGDDVGGDEDEPEDQTEGPAGEVVGPVFEDELEGYQVCGR